MYTNHRNWCVVVTWGKVLSSFCDEVEVKHHRFLFLPLLFPEKTGDLPVPEEYNMCASLLRLVREIALSSVHCIVVIQGRNSVQLHCTVSPLIFEGRSPQRHRLRRKL